MKNPHAVALGRRARGVKKRITEADRQRRREWARGLAKMRKGEKWPHPVKTDSATWSDLQTRNQRKKTANAN